MVQKKQAGRLVKLDLQNILFIILLLMHPEVASGFGTPDSIDIPFLDASPLIDGNLDKTLEELPIYAFQDIIKTNEKTNPLDIQYRLAYGVEFLYLYINVPKEKLIVRDRAYQNGDGFHLAVLLPQENRQPSDEFYVLGFSPDSSSRRKFIWYYNLDLAFRPLESTKLAVESNGETTGLELLIPWSELYPYHPWIQDSMGFNLCFVQAIGEKDKIYYFIKYDPKFQSEKSRRLYKQVRFLKPEITGKIFSYQILEKNHLFQSDTIYIKAAIVSNRDTTAALPITVLSGEGERIAFKMISLDSDKGINRISFPLEIDNLIPGGYQISFGSDRLNTGLSILPEFNEVLLSERLNSYTARLQSGSISTVRFMIQQIAKQLKELKPYDTATKIRFMIYNLESILKSAEKGIDMLAGKTGIFRRAYRSRVDGSLQPYSVGIPEGITTDRKYPLLVYLHGSGEDDRNQLQKVPEIEGVIRLAPYGRGTSNAYSSDLAQDDIRESVSDVIENYPVDSSRIVLTGFSMGGYGVYRTFYEYPHRFKALAVFSGHPNLANQYLEGNHPDFLNKDFLSVFRDVPVFIFHGKRDRNCPFELTLKLVQMLKNAGARVTFISEPDKGHERPGNETLEIYESWLREVMDL